MEKVSPNFFIVEINEHEPILCVAAANEEENTHIKDRFGDLLQPLSALSLKLLINNPQQKILTKGDQIDSIRLMHQGYVVPVVNVSEEELSQAVIVTNDLVELHDMPELALFLNAQHIR